MNNDWKRLDGPEQMGLRFFEKIAKKKVSMKFGHFSNSSTSYPKLTMSIPDAPRSGAIRIFVVSFG